MRCKRVTDTKPDGTRVRGGADGVGGGVGGAAEGVVASCASFDICGAEEDGEIFCFVLRFFRRRLRRVRLRRTFAPTRTAIRIRAPKRRSGQEQMAR